jgi:hypothetical protein
MLMAPFNVHKMMEIHHKKTLNYIIKIYFQIFKKNGIRFIISNIS